jgi:hypothetical protein
MYRPAKNATFLIIVLFGSACTTASLGGHERPLAPNLSRNVIGESELGTIEAATAHDIVLRLRPTFLHWTRVASSHEVRLVYLDGVEIGGVEQLKAIPGPVVAEIRFVRGIESGGRYGRSNSAGAILVRTKLGNPR